MACIDAASIKANMVLPAAGMLGQLREWLITCGIEPAISLAAAVISWLPSQILFLSIGWKGYVALPGLD